MIHLLGYSAAEELRKLNFTNSFIIIIRSAARKSLGLGESETNREMAATAAVEGTVAVSLPPSSLHKNASPFSSSFRFLRFAEHPNPSPNPANGFELEEGDVVWSAELYSDLSAGGESPDSSLPASGFDDFSPRSPSHRRRRPFASQRFGLSAALAEDRGLLPLQQPRAAINLPIGRGAAAAAAAAAAAGGSRAFRQSAPLIVPAWPKVRQQQGGSLMEVEEGGDEDQEEEMLPPHVIVARSHVTTFSVFEGVGRTLKGRDLRRVRNAVFQQTGFLD
ncbi:hypothetical protein AXF42_Ash012649 [Apostasia shenzhenica]|uniref:Senescence regulator S40 n=1 Tax=Apostasia shenzhenica TaxID=1088818 RepID=A0A2H9ZTA3_9ASPA|nr:hypothetical protein AXF42_Ash012649 [Apostasia shenzhenica]